MTICNLLKRIYSSYSSQASKSVFSDPYKWKAYDEDLEVGIIELLLNLMTRYFIQVKLSGERKFKDFFRHQQFVCYMHKHMFN